MTDSGQIKKLLIAGIGGQGVVYLTNLITEAALEAGLNVASSEIHGLAQRRGSVVSGVTFGPNSFGYIEEGGADFLIGLEPLEALRYPAFLHSQSRVIIDDRRISPHAVNSGKLPYPDMDNFVSFLNRNIAQVIINENYPSDLKSIYRNIFLLAKATRLEGFPLSPDNIDRAIEKTVRPSQIEETRRAFQIGLELDK